MWASEEVGIGRPSDLAPNFSNIRRASDCAAWEIILPPTATWQPGSRVSFADFHGDFHGELPPGKSMK